MWPNSMTWFVMACVMLAVAVASWCVVGVAVYNTMVLVMGAVMLIISIVVGKWEDGQ